METPETVSGQGAQPPAVTTDKVKELEEKYTEAVSRMKELANENAVVRQRLSEIEFNKTRVEDATPAPEEILPDDPVEAVKHLSKKIRTLETTISEKALEASRMQSQGMVNRMETIGKYREANKDMAAYEKFLAPSVSALETQINPKTGHRYQLEEALALVTAEFKAANKNGRPTPRPSEPTESAAQLEEGSSVPKTEIGKKEEPDDARAELAERIARQKSKGQLRARAGK